MQKYDVAIIGGGIGGLMAAYGLIEKNPDLQIVIIDKGHTLKNRSCPRMNKESNQCVGCNPCSVMCGFAGAGAYSDGKFILTTEYGGNLGELVGYDLAIQSMELADSILQKHGASDERFYPNLEFEESCKKNGLSVRKGIVKHFGTENNLKIMSSIIQYLDNNCTLLPDSLVTDVNPDKHFIYINGSIEIFATNIVFSIGRSGANFFNKWCLKNSIKVNNNKIDLGVRIELKSEVWQAISQIVYDPKIYYISEKYKDEVRMFCFNEGGEVVVENTYDVMTVNGHAYSDPHLKTLNSNFALLVSIQFSEPFDKSVEYVRDLARCANYISSNNIVVQRFGDLIVGCRTTEEKLYHSSITPSLNAYPGDLSLCLPKRQLDSIIEMIYKLDKIAPGTASEDTLLYGIEGKYYSSFPEMKNFELVGYSSIYACGDGCGISRSLAQAAANGLILSDIIHSTNSNI